MANKSKSGVSVVNIEQFDFNSMSDAEWETLNKKRQDLKRANLEKDLQPKKDEAVAHLATYEKLVETIREVDPNFQRTEDDYRKRKAALESDLKFIQIKNPLFEIGGVAMAALIKSTLEKGKLPMSFTEIAKASGLSVEQVTESIEKNLNPKFKSSNYKSSYVKGTDEKISLNPKPKTPKTV